MAPQDFSPSQNDEARYRALLNAFPEAILIHDPETGAILDANIRASELFGHPMESFPELTMDDLSVGLYPCTQVEALQWIKKATEEGPQRFEWLARTRKGHLFWTEIYLHLTTLEGERRVFSTIRDITEAKHLSSEHAARLKRAEAQNTVFLGLAEAGSDFPKALRILAHFLATEMGDLCVLELLDASKRLVPMAVDQPYLDGRDLLPDLQEIHEPSSAQFATTQSFTSGEALRLTDPTGNRPLDLVREEFHPFLRRYHVHSLMAVPMRSQGKAMGAILMGKGSASRPYTQEEQGMLQNLADRAALALTNARLFAENLTQAEALRQANQELEARVESRTQELAQANERLQRLAVEDALTGLANRRRFNECLDEELRRMRRSGDVLSLLICDVDFFKRYNDHYGHAGGDGCLRVVGEVLREVFKRAGEVPARYGGEEFAVVMPGISADHARRAAEKLRLALNERALPHAHSEVAPHVTISVGVVTAPVGAETDANWFIERADEALYRSKHGGRNRVTTSQFP